MTVAEMLERMSSSELTEWSLFYRIEAAEAETARVGQR